MPASSSAFLNTYDIEKSAKFYESLGFKRTSSTKAENGALAYVDLSFQGAELGLGNIKMNNEKEFREWVGTPLGAGVVLYFTVPDVDPIYAKAKAAGATIEYPPTDRSYGRVFGLNDPDGYVVSFIAEAAPAKKAAKKSAAKKSPAKKGAAKKSAKKQAAKR